MEKYLEIYGMVEKPQAEKKEKEVIIPKSVEITNFGIEANQISFWGPEAEMSVVYSLFSQAIYFCKLEGIEATFSFTKALQEDLGLKIEVYFNDEKQAEMLGDLIIDANQTLTLDSIKGVNNRGLKLVKEKHNN